MEQQVVMGQVGQWVVMVQVGQWVVKGWNSRLSWHRKKIIRFSGMYVHLWINWIRLKRLKFVG
jgi:hypothetical protein